MNFREELTALLEANVGLVNVVTYEEDRVVKLLEDIDRDGALGLVCWDVADGFRVLRQGREAFPEKDCSTDTLLNHLSEKAPSSYVFVLKDFHHSWSQKRAYVTRKLRNMVGTLRAKNQCLIFVTPESGLPVELKNDTVVLHLPLPDENDLGELFHALTSRLDRDLLPSTEVREKLIASALGLTTNQAQLAFARVLAHYQRFDERGIDLVTAAKQQVIRENGALEFWPRSEAESDVGGLDALKAWLKKRALGFTREAREARVSAPRGVALIGIPGTGKSLSAKMLSRLWKLPLLRLDVGALFGSLLGESESNMRRATQLAETVSPCILWIDELEKAFAGSAAAAGPLSSGAASRVFGTFLTWMQEHDAPVFVLATANDVEGLPPELLARFDRTFFLDLPTLDERREIFAIHLRRAGETFPERRFALDDLAERSTGLVGREIEHVVREAQFTALADGNRELEQEDLLAALEETVPLSKSHHEVIANIRRWKLDGRATPASSVENL